ncbi:MAG: ComF family protein, partial [Bacteroidales bacterium]
IGYELGRIFGNELKNSRFFNHIDLIVPVPLHPRKQRQRGYNQSEWIARGMAESMQKSLDIKSLYRTVDTESQTNKTKYDRWKNVENIFAVKYPETLIGKHVLIVDDVITTGSTLEACAAAIHNLEGTRVSAATLAMA